MFLSQSFSHNPPTGESCLLNAKPSHFQACMWRHAYESRPPLLDLFEHGWIRDTVNKILTPVMLLTGVPPAPDYISVMIKCSCENCGSARCSCVSSAVRCVLSFADAMAVSSAVRCTVFCGCDGSNECLNSRRGIMRLCKCQIQIAIRKMTNKGIAMLCQHINDSFV